MAHDGLNDERIRRLIEAVVAKIMAKQASIGEAEGEVVIRAFRRKVGWDVKLRIDI